MSIKRLLIGISILIVGLSIALGSYIYLRYKAVDIPPQEDSMETMVSDGSFSYPEGFTLTTFASGIKDARTIIEDSRGRLLVSQPSEGKVSVLTDTDNDGTADTVTTLIEGLSMPHGLAFRCESQEDCVLYVAATNELYSYTYNLDTATVGAREPQIALPSGSIGAHRTRSLLFLPTEKKDKLLISVGSSCNVCEEKDTRRGTVLVYDIASHKVEHYATGLRNAVFMTLHPVTQEVFVTEMGRDGLGDNVPPDEINNLKEGNWYGWPWFFGKNIEDMSFSPNSRPSFVQEPTPSLIDIPAHSAPLGISFIPATSSWSEEYRLNAVVAYHGSWNRSEPTGYKVVRMLFDKNGTYIETKDFITGWLRPDGKTIGRPAGVLALPNGKLYITDDQAGKVFLLQQK